MTKKETKIVSAFDGKLEFAYGDKFSNYQLEAIAHQREQLDLAGRVALALAEKMALWSAEPDGEDSAGRQALKLMSPADVAARSVDIAEALVASLQNRGHVELLPSWNEINSDDQPAA